ncbi:MAG: hypothetical protein PGN25_00700 [Methylorubrum populi]
MTAVAFEDCVFINCPFDADYDPLLQAILFCIVYLGLTPRLARERADGGAVRLDKIVTLIEGAKYSIHDLSRCQARKKGEHYRLNMPFELGVDYGCRKYYGGNRASKTILILEERNYRYQAALSDLAGCDIEAHGGSFETAVRKVRNWLVAEAGIKAQGAGAILDAYDAFQGWYYKRQQAAGFSEQDILDYATPELLAAMRDWVALGRPL